MANGLKITFEGLDGVQKKINELPTKLRNRLDAEIGFAAEDIAGRAKQDAPADQGILRNEISVKKVSPLTYEVVSGALYTAFVEFGTRSKFQIPPGLQEFVDIETSKPGASSLSAKEAIFAWCKRKGIEPKAWYPIFISIMVKGINPHPFFYKQAPIVKPILKKNIQNVLDNLDKL